MKKTDYINRKTVKWLFFQAKPFFSRLTVIVILNTISIFTSIYLAILTKNLIDIAAAAARLINVASLEADTGFFRQAASVLGENPDVTRNILFYLAIIFLNAAIGMTSSFLSMRLNEKFEFYIRRQLFDKILNTRWFSISEYHSGDLLTRLTGDVNSVSSGLINTSSAVISLIIGFTASFVTLLFYDPSLAVFALVLAPAAVFLSRYLGKKLKNMQTQIQENETLYRSFMQESIANVTVIKSFTAEKRMSNRLDELYQNRIRLIMKRNKLSVIMSNIISFAFSLGYLTALAWGIVKIALNMMSYGTLSVFLVLVNRIQSPVIGLASAIPSFASIFASAARIMEIDALPHEKFEKSEIETKALGISFNGVSFSYTKKCVFENFNIDIKPGSLVALTGASGIGKTTFIRLMMAFIEAQKGKILYYYNDKGGKKQEFSLTSGIREYISYVPQGNTLLSGSIKDNILISNNNLADADIFELLKAVEMADFIKNLPDGVNTRIGEKALGLSEGQAERIAIARALAKKSPLLIFDESTSALDEKTEMSIINNIKLLENRPTCIFVTHRREILPLLDYEIDFEKEAGIMKL